MFIGMYGLPAYNEIDPTILIGITYSVLFGFMFGDVGQGLCLLAGGYLLYRFKKMNLAAIISCCGFFPQFSVSCSEAYSVSKRLLTQYGYVQRRL